MFYGTIIAFTTLISYIIIPLTNSLRNGVSILNLHTDIINQFNNEDMLLKCRTFAFSVLGLSELFHMIGMSSEKMSLLEIIKKKNYFMMIVVLISLILQVLVVQLPICNYLFKTVPLSILEWVLLLMFSVIPIIVHELVI